MPLNVHFASNAELELFESLLYTNGLLPRDELDGAGCCRHCGTWRGSQSNPEAHEHSLCCPLTTESARLRDIAHRYLMLASAYEPRNQEAVRRLVGGPTTLREACERVAELCRPGAASLNAAMVELVLGGAAK